MQINMRFQIAVGVIFIGWEIHILRDRGLLFLMFITYLNIFISYDICVWPFVLCNFCPWPILLPCDSSISHWPYLTICNNLIIFYFRNAVFLRTSRRSSCLNDNHFFFLFILYARCLLLLLLTLVIGFFMFLQIFHVFITISYTKSHLLRWSFFIVIYIFCNIIK